VSRHWNELEAGDLSWKRLGGPDVDESDSELYAHVVEAGGWKEYCKASAGFRRPQSAIFMEGFGAAVWTAAVQKSVALTGSWNGVVSIWDLDKERAASGTVRRISQPSIKHVVDGLSQYIRSVGFVPETDDLMYYSSEKSCAVRISALDRPGTVLWEYDFFGCSSVRVALFV
jgi:hypothetical protein